MESEQPANANGQPPNTPAPASPPRKPIDEKTVALLRAAARRRRPWSAASCLLALLVFGVPLGLFVWWFWPRPAPPRVAVIAFDQLAVQGGSVTCRARVVTADPGQADADLSGRELTFQMRRAGQPAHEKGDVEKAATQADGSAAVTWALPEGVVRLDFSVWLVEASRMKDRARIFAWPRKTKILLVEESALPSPRNKLWPEAVRTLRAAGAEKFAVAYLATGEEGAVAYAKVRNGLEGSTTSGIPDGPVLGRLSVGGATAAEFPTAVVTHLRGFEGPLVVLAGRRETEAAYRAAGVRVLRVGQGRLAWADVAKQLAK